MHLVSYDETSQGPESISISITSKSQKYSTPHFLRHRWHSKQSYYSSMMVATCSIYYFDVGIKNREVVDLNCFMMVLAYILAVLPMYYMQILLGQFTQMGVVLLRYMSPAATGVVISFMLVMVVQSVKLGIYTADFLTYFSHSFRSRLEWLKCPKSIAKTCWNNEPVCDHTNCMNATVHPSTLYYYNMVYMEGGGGIDPNKFFQTPSLHRIMVMILFWAIVCLTINFVGMRLRKLIIRLWIVIVIVLSVNVLHILARNLNVDVVVDILLVNTTALTDFEAWCAAINDPIILMGLGKGVHVLHGSYIEFGETWEGASILATSFNFGVMFMCVLFGRGCMYSLKKEARLDKDHLKLFWNKGPYMYFVAIPMALGLYRIPQLWNIIYCLVCILMITGNQLLLVKTLDKTFCDTVPTMVKYSKYISTLTCIIIVMISSLLSAKYGYTERDSFGFRLANMIELTNTFLLSFFVCWIYGVQNFCDDIHYMRGSQPAKFWKVTWYCMPAVFGVSYIYTAFFLWYPTFTTVEMWLIMIYLLPLPICALYETFRFIKKKNILGLLQSEEQFGPPDPLERYLRRLFNPRQETKLKRRSEKCNHRCLLNSKVLKRAVAEEEVYKKSYLAQ